MIKLYDVPVSIQNDSYSFDNLKDAKKENTLSYEILQKHNTSGNKDKLKIKFDKLISHDITYVGIIQTARASGLKHFPIEYVLTNCHNSLCAVGGTINEDDHLFGLSAAKKYGGVYVPPHQAVIHQYAREMMAECGAMILGSDSHTRYGALGTMAIGEGGPELVKQILSQTYDVDYPEVVAIYLDNEVQPMVGPQDVALAIIGEVFKSGFVNNKIMEFVGPGVSKLSAEFRIGIDVMTTETTCLSSIWETDDMIEEYYRIHGREKYFKYLRVDKPALYDKMVYVDLSKIKPMIALPFHPSYVYEVDYLNANAYDILKEVEEKSVSLLGNKVKLSLVDKLRDGKIYVEQGIIAGCSGGGYENICEAANILEDASIGNDVFSLSVYPASMPIYKALLSNGAFGTLIDAGAVVKTAFCGPCFGAGDTPANNSLSIRHTTRNFPNREGSKIQDFQISSVALMDSRSIAATALNQGYLTSATGIPNSKKGIPQYFFDKKIYETRVFNAVDKANDKEELRLGPNIKDWPTMPPLKDNLLIRMISIINDDVTTTDELIPSGETSSYRSNPIKLAEYTLSRKDPDYVPRAKEVQKIRSISDDKEVEKLINLFNNKLSLNINDENLQIGSSIFARKPGDGSAREQAASCQRVLGASANIAYEYATKRYRSNLINWGIIPFIIEETPEFKLLDYVLVPDVKEEIKNGSNEFKAYTYSENEIKSFTLKLAPLTKDEIDIILSGCLINYNRID